MRHAVSLGLGPAGGVPKPCGTPGTAAGPLPSGPDSGASHRVALLRCPLVFATAVAAPTIQSDGEPCEGASLQERVDGYLASSQTDASGWSGRSRLSIEPDGSATVTLHIGAPDGSSNERSFVAERCEVALDAAAFVLATAIDPDVEARFDETAVVPVPVPEPGVPAPSQEPIPEPESPEPGPGPPPVSPPPSEPPPAVPRPQPAPWEVGLLADAGVMGGALPAANAVFELGAALGRGRWRTELSASVRLPSESRSNAVPGVSGRLGMWAVTARGCGHPRTSRVSFPLCAGFEVGQAFGQGRGFRGASGTRVPWGAAILGPAVRVDIARRWFVFARGELGVPLNRAEFVVDGLESLHTIGSVFGRGVAGVEVRLGPAVPGSKRGG